MEANSRAARRPLLMSLAMLALLGLLVTGAMVSRTAQVASHARTPAPPGAVPFAALFEERFVASSCSGLACQVKVEGIGTTTSLGSATELVWESVDASSPPCYLLQDTRTLTATNGSGSLFVSGTGRECPVANGSTIALTFSWIITGGTMQFGGASGYGTETGTGSTVITVHYNGLLSFTVPSIRSPAGHPNYK